MNIELIEPAAATEPQDIAEIRDGLAVVKLNRTEAGLAQLRTDLAGKDYDLTTTKGDKEARSDRLRCVSLRASVEKLRKTLKAPALEFGKLIDSEAKRITEAVESLESPIDAAIRADETRREEERQAKLRVEAERLAGMRTAAALYLEKWVERCNADGITAERIAAGADMLEEQAPNADWREVNDFWQSAKAQALATMRRLHSEAQQREEAARLKEQREEQERQAAIQRQQSEELARQRAELEAQANVLRDEAAALAEAQRKAADAEAQRIAAAEQRAREQEAARIAAQQAEDARVAAMAVAAAPAQAPVLAAAPVVTEPQAVRAAAPLPRIIPAMSPAEPATLSLGAICGRLGFTVNGDFLRDTLHVAPARTDKREQLYTELQYQAICRQLLTHVGAMAELYAGDTA
jgi:colicin import membrane protein